jgi:[protein-PII] uridylyltransferase
MPVSTLRSNVLAAKQRLADAYLAVQRRHENGASGVEVSTLLTNVRDEVIVELFDAALADLGEDGPRGLAHQVALVAHGGYGRRDVAPFSDVDIMMLHSPQVADRIGPLADRLLRDVFDAGLIMGHSVRTPDQACSLARDLPVICTSLMESRRLTGDRGLFEQFLRRFQRSVRGRMRALLTAIHDERQAERLRYGETVFLLEPNLKRSRGGLRDVQFVRWIGYARYGKGDPAELEGIGALTADERTTLERASEFLLWLRNEMHFASGQGNDVLSRAEQLRIAERRGYAPVAGLLAVEQFMRDYFRHTQGVSQLANRFEARAAARPRIARLSTALFGRLIDPGTRLGPAGVMVGRAKLEQLRGNLAGIIRLVDLANLYQTTIAPGTWDFVLGVAPSLPREITPAAAASFLSLLRHPGRLGLLLRDLHDAAILERFIPEFAHARGLLQFNQYHKYTVDEHCLRAVECAVDLLSNAGPLGRVYRSVACKHVLHLALLIHDLGKGHLEDHRELGMKIAERAAARLGLSPREAEMLQFLVRRHELMNHEAFHRDSEDEQTVVRLAVSVGSPELLEMLYIMTACDLSAVGPGVWDTWKSDVVTRLFHRTMEYLAVESPATTADAQLERQRDAIRQALGNDRADAWFAAQIDSLPAGYLHATSPEQAAADLRLLRSLGPKAAAAEARYQPETNTVRFTVGTSEAASPGIFHKLTGALTSRGLAIRAAQIYTLADGLILDRFWVGDPDFNGEPPADRLAGIHQALMHAIETANADPPTFRRTWRPASTHVALPAAPTRVSFDNSTSDRYSIIDIFTHDRTGLLYTITRTLFELELSVWRSKVGTYLDQVVDVFYVTDMQGRKIEDEQRLEQCRRRLLDVLESTREKAG